MAKTTKKRHVVDARADSDGNITHVKLNDNQKWTSVEKAMDMADKGKIDNAHTIRSKGAKEFFRTNPDGSRRNNLDEMAGDD
ncbi:MAG: DUF3892 domain-containing protein [Aquisalimonadaceae bacterium]